MATQTAMWAESETGTSEMVVKGKMLLTCVKKMAPFIYLLLLLLMAATCHT